MKGFSRSEGTGKFARRSIGKDGGQGGGVRDVFHWRSKGGEGIDHGPSTMRRRITDGAHVARPTSRTRQRRWGRGRKSRRYQTRPKAIHHYCPSKDRRRGRLSRRYGKESRVRYSRRDAVARRGRKKSSRSGRGWNRGGDSIPR
jgi:hypothetical protein